MTEDMPYMMENTREEFERVRDLACPVPDLRFRDQLAERVLIARCENVTEPDGQECPGRLRYRWGQIEAACDTCGGRCGIAVAAWLDVQPNAEVGTHVQAAANQRDERDELLRQRMAEAAYRNGWRDGQKVAALASPAPAPRAEEGQ